MKANSHFEWIDFLRGASALAIIIYHVRVDLWVGWVAISSHPESFSDFDRFAAWFSVPFPLVRFAVMLFFLVSGFCIHYPYVSGNRPLKLKAYSIRRFWRIYPPYLAAIVFTLFVEWLRQSHFGEAVTPEAKIFSTVLMIQNYGLDPGQMVTNPSFWSLPIEVELYLVYPIFYWLIMRYGIQRSIVLVGAVSISTLLFLVASDLRITYTNLGYIGNFAVYWIIWCAGAWLAEGTKNKHLPKWTWQMWVVTSVLLLASLVATFFNLFIGIQSLVWASFYFMLMFWGLAQKDPLKFLNRRIKNLFLTVGTISYSLYLIHYPLYKLWGSAWVNFFSSKPTNFFIPISLSLACIPIAYLFYTWIEVPSHKLAKKLAA